MKKYFVLTSILALAACGGGSGGGGSHGGVAPVHSAVPANLHGGAIEQTILDSNDKVTKMNSEVIVASNSLVPLSRSASATSGGVTFTSYRLDDVKFYAADATTTQDGYLRLGLNENTGRIDNMYMVVGGIGADADNAIARDGETSTFKAPIFEYVQDTKKGEVAAAGISGLDDPELENQRLSNDWPSKGYWKRNGDKYEYYKLGDQALFRTVGTSTTTMDSLTALETTNSLSGGHWNRTDEVLPVVTYGGNIDGNGTSLQYSDFGHFNPVYETKRVFLNGGSEATAWTNDAKGEYKEHNETEMNAELAKEDYQLFAGGYAISGTTMDEDRPSFTPSNGDVYKGMAVGRVYTSIHGGNSFADKKANAITYGVLPSDTTITEEQFNNQEVGRDIAKEFKTYDATMRITQSGDDLVQTLKMPFYTHAVGDKYYDVTIVQTGNVVTSTNFDAAGLDDNDVGNQIASQYRKYDAFDDPTNIRSQDFEPGYYGVNTPSEAAGTAAIRAGYDIANGGERDYEVQAAWGMKKQ